MSTSFGKSAEAGTAAGVLPAMRSRIALAAVMSLPSGNPRLSYSAQGTLEIRRIEARRVVAMREDAEPFRLSNGVGMEPGSSQTETSRCQSSAAPRGKAAPTLQQIRTADVDCKRLA